MSKKSDTFSAGASLEPAAACAKVLSNGAFSAVFRLPVRLLNETI